MGLKLMLIIFASVFVILVGIVLISSFLFKQKVKTEAAQLFAQHRTVNSNIITEEDLKKLPEPVQRYLKYSQVVGKKRLQTVRLKQQGCFRLRPDQSWSNLEAEQYYTTNPPAFLWYARVKVAPFVWIAGRDLFTKGKGNMLIRLFSTITVADGKGAEMDQGALVRYLSEIIWFPTAWLSEYISWEPIDSTSAKVTMHCGDASASGILHINNIGELTNFEAQRYRTVDNGYSLDKWSTPITEYREMNGFRIPSKGVAAWHLESGEFFYIQVEVTEVEYDKPLAF